MLKTMQHGYVSSWRLGICTVSAQKRGFEPLRGRKILLTRIRKGSQNEKKMKELEAINRLAIRLKALKMRESKRRKKALEAEKGESSRSTPKSSTQSSISFFNHIGVGY